MHEARRRARRLRFTAEFVVDLYGEPAEVLIEAVTQLQDIFGEHQDCYAAIDLRRRLGASLPVSSRDLAGRLDEQDRERAVALRRAAPDAVKRVKKRWKVLRGAMKSAYNEG
jgi:CHAD domain-containing protein